MRLRLTAVLLIVTLVVVAGCSMRTAKAAGAEKDLILKSRQFNGATVNLGQMYLDGKGPFNLPYSTRVLPGVHQVRFIPLAGFYWAALEAETPTGSYTIQIELNPLSSSSYPFDISEDDPTITAIYQQIGLPAYVGGVVLPTNAYAIFAPYLAVIGLAATAAAAIKKRRN